MPTKLSSTTLNSIVSAVPPVLGNGITLPSHSYIMKITETVLEENKIKIATVNNEPAVLCIGSQKNEIVATTYTLETDSSSDYRMVFCWVNAYTRSMRFRCAIGCQNKENNAIYVKNVFTVRKGGSDLDIKHLIDSVVKEAPALFDNLVSDLEALSLIIKSREEVSETLGRIFFDKNLVTPHQASSLQKWMTDSFKDVSVWKMSDMYEMLSLVSYNFHPRFWLEAHAEIHGFMTDAFDVSNPLQITQPVIEPPTENVVEVKQENINSLINEAVIEEEEAEEDSYSTEEVKEEEFTEEEETEEVEETKEEVEEEDTYFPIDKEPSFEDTSNEEKEEVKESLDEDEDELPSSNSTFDFEW